MWKCQIEVQPCSVSGKDYIINTVILGIQASTQDWEEAQFSTYQLYLYIMQIDDYNNQMQIYDGWRKRKFKGVKNQNMGRMGELGITFKTVGVKVLKIIK